MRGRHLKQMWKQHYRKISKNSEEQAVRVARRLETCYNTQSIAYKISGDR